MAGRGKTISVILLLCGLSGFGSALLGDGYQEGTVYFDSGAFSYKLGVMDKSGVAYGYYNNTLNATGWGTFEVKSKCSQSTCNDSVLMFAAGLLEGLLTARQIWLQYGNVKPFFLEDQPKDIDEKFRKFFADQDKWMRSEVQKHGTTDPYWRHVSYIVSQFDGLYAGYKAKAESGWETDAYVLQFLNGIGDLLDIKSAVNPEGRPDFTKFTRKEMEQYFLMNSRCSALVKVTGGYENMFMSHNSWFIYGATARIYKHYHLSVSDNATAAISSSFSSYPGFLESLDDFYIMDTKLVLLQTTNAVLNHSLFDLITPQSLLAWHRVRIANMMARSGSQWFEAFKRYNSGTYNNQYMVIDLNRVTLKKAINNDALWIIEQIPGLVVGQDQTPILRTGYWPSYNVPFYEITYNLSGYPLVMEYYGLDYSYQLAPRAKIFRRDVGTVVDMESMKAMSRYNDYLNDEYSEKNPLNAICCRGDLADAASAFGCYDTKVTDYKMALEMTSFAVSGPTTSSGLKPFSWSKSQFADTTKHVGLPDTYNFNWITTKPKFQ